MSTQADDDDDAFDAECGRIAAEMIAERRHEIAAALDLDPDDELVIELAAEAIEDEIEDWIDATSDEMIEAEMEAEP